MSIRSFTVCSRLLRPRYEVPKKSGPRSIKVDEELLGTITSEISENCPVTAGGIIRGDGGETFEAVRKIGWGVNSTVWVGRDCSAKACPKYVALKILNKYATHEHDESSGKKTSELKILLRTYIGKEPDHRPQKPLYREQGLKDPPHPGWFRVSGCLGFFSCENNPQHFVIVFPLYGENMKEFMCDEPNKRLTAPLVKKVAKDTLLALDYIHSYCGIIHCDVKPENILVDFNIGNDVDDLFEIIMKKEPNAGRQGYAASLWLPHHILENPRVVLSDFSHASWNDLIERSPVTLGSAALRAPELIWGFAYGTPIDIWAFGCTIFELLTGKPLFRFPDSRTPNEFDEEPRYHLNLMQALAGEPYFPAAREGTPMIGKDFINSDGWIKSPTGGSTLNELVSKDVPDDVEDKDKFEAFLRRCLKLDPRQRASASELLNDPWLADD
ncbi:hypothetical protein ACEPAG_2242 [Sanghuangporus baumii]